MNLQQGLLGTFDHGSGDANAAAARAPGAAAAREPSGGGGAAAAAAGGGAAAGGCKRCVDCGRQYPMRLFPVVRQAPDGRHTHCFGCRAGRYEQRRPWQPRCDGGSGSSAVRNRSASAPEAVEMAHLRLGLPCLIGFEPEVGAATTHRLTTPLPGYRPAHKTGLLLCLNRARGNTLDR